MEVGFIGFGGAGYGIAKGLKAAGAEIHFFDSLQDVSPYKDTISRYAREVQARQAADPGELLGRVSLVFSLVTAANARQVAAEAAPRLTAVHLYVDANTGSPALKKEVAALIAPSEAGFVDAALMGLVPTALHRVPILAAGSGARRFHDLMTPFGMRIKAIGTEPGAAAAVKLCRSIFMKGFIALLIELLPAASRLGVEELVISSLSESLDPVPFREAIREQLTNGAVNAERMSHEMEDVVAILEEMGLSAQMSRAGREKLDLLGSLGFRERYGGAVPEDPGPIKEALAAVNVNRLQVASECTLNISTNSHRRK